MDPLALNCEKTKKKLVDFIKREVKRRGFSKVIFGLSGGVDSSLVAFLCKDALGCRNVMALIMPYRITSKLDLLDAKKVVRILKIKSKIIDITPMVDSFFKNFKNADKIRRGNKMARERMAILYDQSKAYDALVVGCGNKTEILLGYFTLYGDSACAINPIGDLYKTQVRQLARFVGVPQDIVDKSPSAGLWPGQTDEDEMGFRYDEVDRLLYFMINRKLNDNRLRRLGFKEGFIKKVKDKIKRNRFKQEPPLIAKLQTPTNHILHRKTTKFRKGAK